MRSEESGPDDRTELPSSQPPAAIIDHYRLLQCLGEGGMGEVWLAEQLQPVRRRVAIKVLKGIPDTRQVLARFEAERQALAVLNHAAVAKVFDAGTTAAGRPYFVMEYVPGEPMTVFCDRARLTIAERIQLFIRVCEGVQHAHHKGIIHRDLKPSNILVAGEDDVAVPKIIDFGVAKPLVRPLTDRTLVTEFGMLIGTPEYMSPEQADMTALDIDTRADVYALGIVLYELLAGALPFDSRALRDKGLDEIRRVIREVDPQPPSTRLTKMGDSKADVVARRRTDVEHLRRELRGDLDAIVLKALAKERTRRYSAVSDLATDLERFLRHEPVVARAPSTAYRVGRFVRRHRVGVAAAASMLTLLIAFAMATTLQARRIAVERDRANREAETARQVSDFLVGLFQVSNPGEARGNSVTAREILDAGAAKVQADLDTQPAVQGRLLQTMGTVYRTLGLFAAADPLLTRAMAVTRSAFGDEAAEYLSAVEALGNLRYDQGRWKDAETLMRDVVEGYRRSAPDSGRLFRALDHLARAVWGQGRHSEAERLHREALDGLSRSLGPDHGFTLSAANSLAATLFEQGKAVDAEPLFRRLYDAQRRRVGDDHPETLMALANLAAVLHQQEKLAEAEPFYRAALDTSRRVLGDEHPSTLRRLSNFGELLIRQGKLDEAEEALVQMVGGARRVWPDGHTTLAIGVLHLALLRNHQTRFADAEGAAKEALAYFERTFPPGHSRIAESSIALGRALAGQKRFAEAEGRLLPAYATTKVEARDVREAVGALVELYDAWGKHKEASDWRQILGSVRSVK